jgi:sugar lactone lactonase YvrE
MAPSAAFGRLDVDSAPDRCTEHLGILANERSLDATLAAARRPLVIPRLSTWIAAAALAVPPRAHSAEFVLQPIWIAGGVGNGVGEYGVPESVAIDARGQVVVTDKGRMMLHVYAAETGTPRFDVGAIGSALGRFDRPNGIAIDARGHVLVVEQRNQRVQILDQDYRPVGSFGGSSRFTKPMGIALDRSGRIYVTDEARADVQVFDADGTFLFRFANSAPTLNKVESIEVDDDGGRIFVCDEGRARVNVYGMDGRFQGSFGGQGAGPGQFGNDTNAVRLDGRRRIYVNDQGNTRINVFHADTRFLASFRNADGGFESADGVALSEPHNLFLIADQGHNRIVAFDLGEIQCRLGRLELGSPAAAPSALTGSFDAAPTSNPRAPWADGTLYLEARTSPGDRTRVETALVHVRSLADRRGICVTMSETSAASGILRATIQLGETSDEAGARLATHDADAVQAHLAGDAAELRFEFAQAPAPEATGLAADGATASAGAVRLASDRPRLTWSFTDAARRPQTRYELRLVSGASTWSSGVVAGDATAHRYDGPPLMPGGGYRFELRVAAGRAWSAWTQLPLRRNHPPPVAATQPASGTILRRWPATFVASYPPDADGDPLECHLELRMPNASARQHSLPARDGIFIWVPQFALAENTSFTWRLIATDGHETSAGPWSALALDATPEPPHGATPRLPANKAAVYAADIEFHWNPARDPDPGSVLTYALEWSTTPEFASPRVVPAATATHVRWSEPLADGTLYWRVRAADATGRAATGSVAEVQLARTARIVLRAQTSAGVAQVELGTRPGAHDGYWAGEDAVAGPRTPRFTSRVGAAPALGRDLRAPRDPAIHPIVYELRIEAAGSGPAHVQAMSLSLPAGWRARLQDGSGRTLGSLATPGDAASVALDATGAGSAWLVVARNGDRPPPPDEQLPPSMNIASDDDGSAPAATIAVGTRLALGDAGSAVRVYDARGRMLRLDRADARGTWTWDGRDGRGRRLSRGVYWVQGQAGATKTRRRVVWMN